MELILLIEKDPKTIRTIQGDLEAEGYRVISAVDTETGLSLARTGHPDLILLEMGMARENDFSFLKGLKRDNLTSSCPIVILSGQSSTEDVVQVMKHGVMDYIKKPYFHNLFLKKIRSTLKRSRMKRLEEEASRSSHISIHREPGITGITVISILSRPGERYFIEDAKRIFNHAFFSMIRKDLSVLDLRSVPDMAESDLIILKKIVDLFGDQKLYIVTGRHYGELLSSELFGETHPLFLSFGDLMLFINAEEQGLEIQQR